MERYIGIDAHLKSCTLAVAGPSGRKLSTQVVETNGKALRQVLMAIAGRRHVCLEEGELSEWLYELVEPVVEDVVVVRAQSKRGVKSDERDAWELAQRLLKGGSEGAVYKGAGQFRELREAVHAHRVVMKDLVRAKNRLRALYRSRGIAVEGRDIYVAEKREPWLCRLPKSRRELARLLSEQLDGLTASAKRAEEWLLEEAQCYPIVGLLATAPGIGDVRASQIAATVITPQRFRTKRQFWSYCGLAVVTRSSSDWERDRGGQWVRRNVAACRGLNRNRHPLLKEVFKGAAMSVITLMPEHPLGKNYKRLLEAGTKPPLARLTLARQIAAAVLAMWKNLEAYDPERHERTKAA